VIGQSALFSGFDINREAAARYGLTTGDVQDVIQRRYCGMNITETVEGWSVIRSICAIRVICVITWRPLRRRILIPTPTGSQIP